MDNPASLTVRNDLAELSRLGEWIGSWTEGNAIPELMAGHIDLCAAEAATNVISYAFDDGQSHEFSVRLERDNDGVQLQLEDDGMAFDPTRATVPTPVTLQNERIGGWGISIMRRLSDEFIYHRLDGRNRLTMVFR